MSLVLSVVIPCLNEAASLGICIDRAKSFLQRSNIAGEIVVADNGSTDGSQSIALGLGARVIDVPQRGYGAALMAGIDAALGEFVIMGDADDSYRFDEIDGIVGKLQDGYEFVMGNRFKGGIERGAMPFLNRYLGNPVLSFLGRLFFNTKIGDFQCGLRGFRRQKVLDLNLHTPGMEYASEMVVTASLHNLKMAEVPVKLYKDKRGRAPHMRPWRDGWRYLKFLLAYSPRWLYLYPSMAVMAFGVLIFAALLPGPMHVTATITLDVHTLLVGAMAIIVGLQGLSFCVLARYHTMMLGLYPIRPRSRRIMALFTVERILFVAAIMVVTGLAGIVYQTNLWRSANFGGLDYSAVMRILITSVTLVVAGIQLVFSGFMLAVLGLKK